MGNRQSQTGNQSTHRDGKVGSNNPYQDDDKDGPCVPCFFFLKPLPRRDRSDPMGSPLPETPVIERQKRKHVAAAMQTVPQGKGAYLLPPKYGKKTNAPHLEPELSRDSANATSGDVAIHEGPDAEALLQATYELLEVLGVGSTSTVQKCRHRRTKEVYACKVIDVQQIEERFAGMMAQFQTEIEALRQLQHPGIIGLYDVYISPNKIYIIMECMQGGELFDYVVQKGTLTEEEASQIVRKVTSALVYMHEKNIVHRDLKPENLLLKRKPSISEKSIEVKIIDFGLSKVSIHWFNSWIDPFAVLYSFPYHSMSARVSRPWKNRWQGPFWEPEDIWRRKCSNEEITLELLTLGLSVSLSLSYFADACRLTMIRRQYPRTIWCAPNLSCAFRDGRNT